MASVPRPTRMSPPPSGARRTIATYASYQEAEQAVDLLSDERFPVNRVAIVGTGLRSVEQVDEDVADEARRLLARTPSDGLDSA